ncbi:MAG: glycosyltransferase family 2 protein [Isosphaera sp.]|nr:glycosyltransferase family 2 protein [Isosphaera sp.]
MSPAAPPVPRPPPTPAARAAVDVSVCVANWNCAGLLRNCLRSLFDHPQGVTFEVVVADNASADGAADMVAAEFPRVVLIRNDENRGFAAASNQAAARARGRFLFFLNNDTEVPPLTLRRLVEHAAANPAAGMIGPRLREPSGAVQISYRRRPTIPALLHKLSLFRWTGLFRAAYGEYRRGSFDPDGVRPVEVLMGPAVFLPRAAFDAAGGWDERYRFGVEDIDLSVQVGRAGAVVYAGDVEVVHHGRVSSRGNVGFVAPSVATGYAQYFRKAGVGRLRLFAYKLAVTLDAPVQLLVKVVEAAARRLVGHRADARRSWAAARGVWAFLRGELVRFWRA